MTRGPGWPCPTCGQWVDSVEMQGIHVADHDREEVKSAGTGKRNVSPLAGGTAMTMKRRRNLENRMATSYHRGM